MILIGFGWQPLPSPFFLPRPNQFDGILWSNLTTHTHHSLKQHTILIYSLFFSTYSSCITAPFLASLREYRSYPNKSHFLIVFLLYAHFIYLFGSLSGGFFLFLLTTRDFVCPRGWVIMKMQRDEWKEARGGQWCWFVGEQLINKENVERILCTHVLQ